MDFEGIRDLALSRASALTHEKASGEEVWSWVEIATAADAALLRREQARSSPPAADGAYRIVLRPRDGRAGNPATLLERLRELYPYYEVTMEYDS
jgi:hypothetical protein